ncbi:MAG TPA: uridine kinase [Bacillota bacterium]|nr:uridine kinase [Bacillota bacterium]
MQNKPIVIGIAGGSGSGKTSVTYEVCKRFSKDSILVIEQDSYYKDQSEKTFSERLLTNYDHPDAFDNELLIKQLKQLMNYETILKPSYDYKQHTRSSKVTKIDPKDVIILEGILILHDEQLMDLMDIKVFIDTDADVRIIRRISRDIKERGRNLDSVIDQYLNFVRPMHLQFVEPSKYNADIIIPEGGENHVAIDIIATKIEQYIEQLQKNIKNV